MTKGYTVHFNLGGKTPCGTIPRRFRGIPAISNDKRYVTCPACVYGYWSRS